MTETRREPEASPAPVARNAPCPCGSGKRYKQCCGADAATSGSAAVPQGSRANPKEAEAVFRRGLQTLKSGRLLDAIPILQAAIRSDSNHFEAHQALGFAMLRTGRFADASALLERAVTLRPDSAAAWRNLGTSYDRQNLHEQAIRAYRRAAQFAPQFGEVLGRLGQLYAMYSRMEEASDCYERAAEIKPDTVQAQLYHADARMLRGDIPGAEKWAREAVAFHKESGAAHGTLAGLLYAQGRFEEAVQSFEEALRLNPKEGRCWLGLADCRKYSPADNAILERMHGVLQRGDLDDFNRMSVHFAMGKICDDCGDYVRAMQHFDSANAVRARDLNFDRAGFEAMVDRSIRQFTREFISSASLSGTPEAKPLFVVGMYRSGTTLVEQILSSHPLITAGGELTAWRAEEIEIDPATGAFDPARSRSAIERYLFVLQRIGPTAARVTDKLPFNCFRLGAIHALLPNARIIHCQRDPIDTCLSIYSHPVTSRVGFAARKGDLAFCYRQYLRVMDHWRNVLPTHVFTDVQYERLIVDREGETRRLIAFAGLDWDDSCLSPERNRRPINTASAWQARQPVYATSMQRWRHYEPWLGELRQLLPLQKPNET